MRTCSIIIPVYNVAKYLHECLDSVLAQSFVDWEAICIDDGSTDGGGAILDGYAKKDSRFRVIHQSNSGVSVARNNALDVANGDWLLFLDADDVLAETALSKLLDAARSANADLAMCGIMRFGGESGNIYFGPQLDGMFSPEDLYVEYNSLCTWSCGKIYKRKLWDKVRFPVGIAYSEDRYILHEILYAYPKVPFVAECLYCYRNRGNSAYGSSWKPEWVQRHLALEKQISFFGSRGFNRAKLFTVGLYFQMIGYSDIPNLVKMKSQDTKLIEQLRKKISEFERKYWRELMQAMKKERWARLQSCGNLRICIAMAYLQSGRMSMLKKFIIYCVYDGVLSAFRRLRCKTTNAKRP